MGSCASSHTDPESVIKFKLSLGSKSDKLVMPSPINDKALNNGDHPIGEVGLKPQQSYPSRDVGGKEENFFDSQAWLDSDCDDDFLSVNGEFTPSRGNTPVHHSFAAGNPLVNKAFFEDSGPGGRPEPSPTDQKTRLSDLFKGSLRVYQDLDEHNTSGSLNETTYASGIQSSERTPIGKFKPYREKSSKFQCCLPSLCSSRSLSDSNREDWLQTNSINVDGIRPFSTFSSQQRSGHQIEECDSSRRKSYLGTILDQKNPSLEFTLGRPG